MHNLYILSAILVVVSCINCVKDEKKHPSFPRPRPVAPKTKEEKITEPLNATTKQSKAVTNDASELHERGGDTPKRRDSIPLSKLGNLIQEIQEEIKQFEEKNN
ncbi:MAG: hypothetical protein MUC61_00920 [Amoebophilaceae bacterium]|jgi:hypothetical protein|nr:hypothetical protein [Amoebophilaceae bacterium]